MIPRYQTKEMAQIWSENNKYSTWEKVEITVTEVLADFGQDPKEAIRTIIRWIGEDAEREALLSTPKNKVVR